MEPAKETLWVRQRPMREGFGFLLRFFSERFLAPIRFSPSHEATLRELAGKGHLIYVMSNASVLYYLFLNFWCLRLQIPLASYGNGIQLFSFFQPVRHVVRGWIHAVQVWLGRVPNDRPISLADLVRSTLQARRSLVLFLRHSRRSRKSSPREPGEMLHALLDFQAATSEPVFLVPVDILWGKKPAKVQPSLVDLTLGDQEAPGLTRRILMLLRYRKHSVATLGHVVNLQNFLRENTHVEPDLLRKKLRWSLYRELSRAATEITGPRLKPRKYIVQSILSSMRLRTLAREMARAEGTTFEKVMKRASRFAHEIAADYSITYIEFLDLVLTWVWNNIYSGFTVDRKGIEAVKRASRHGSLLLLPSHKSHVDYLVLSYAFYHHDLPPPHIAAGVNLSFWPLGRIFRKAGAFFIRRTFRGQALYQAVFQTYVKWLQRERYVQEFFLEGTRSRTGKLMSPKLGMLSMELDIFSEGVTDDLYLIPVSISYEKVVEEASYTDESGGARKDRERLRDLLKTRRFLRKKYGRVYIQFAEPLSVRQYFQQRQVDYTRLGRDGRLRIAEDLARRTAFAINGVTTVTPAALVATVLLNHARRGITQVEIHQRASFLFSLLQDLQANVSLSLQNFRWAIDEALEAFAADKVLQEWDDPEGKIYTLDEAKRFPLNYYKNNIIHFFLPAAFAAAAFRLEGTRTLSESDFGKGIDFLFHLFRKEFIFPAQHALQVYTADMERLLVGKRGVLLRDEAGWTVADPEVLGYLENLILSFFESYAVFLKTVERILPAGGCEERELIKRALETGDRLYRRGDLVCPESRSVFVYRNALARMKDLEWLGAEEKRTGTVIVLTRKGETELPLLQNRLAAFLSQEVSAFGPV